LAQTNFNSVLQQNNYNVHFVAFIILNTSACKYPNFLQNHFKHFESSLIPHTESEEVGSSSDASFYSTCTQFERRLQHLLPWLKFSIVFCGLSKQFPEYYFRMVHDRFLIHDFNLSFRLSPYQSKLYIGDTDSVVK